MPIIIGHSAPPHPDPRRLWLEFDLLALAPATAKTAMIPKSAKLSSTTHPASLDRPFVAMQPSTTTLNAHAAAAVTHSARRDAFDGAAFAGGDCVPTGQISAGGASPNSLRYDSHVREYQSSNFESSPAPPLVGSWCSENPSTSPHSRSQYDRV